MTRGSVMKETIFIWDGTGTQGDESGSYAFTYGTAFAPAVREGRERCQQQVRAAVAQGLPCDAPRPGQTAPFREAARGERSVLPAGHDNRNETEPHPGCPARPRAAIQS